MVIFHSHIKLPEGKLLEDRFDLLSVRWRDTESLGARLDACNLLRFRIYRGSAIDAFAFGTCELSEYMCRRCTRPYKTPVFGIARTMLCVSPFLQFPIVLLYPFMSIVLFLLQALIANCFLHSPFCNYCFDHLHSYGIFLLLKTCWSNETHPWVTKWCPL